MCQRIYMRQYASSPRKDKSGYERDYKGLQMTQVALPAWLAYQRRRSLGETSVQGSIVA